MPGFDVLHRSLPVDSEIEKETEPLISRNSVSSSCLGLYKERSRAARRDSAETTSAEERFRRKDLQRREVDGVERGQSWGQEDKD